MIEGSGVAVLKGASSADVQKLDTCLRAAQEGIRGAQEELEGRFSRALTMLGNSRDELSGQLSKTGRSLSSLGT